MRLSTNFSLVAILLLAFAYWGLETVAGRHAYDEMDGMIPMGAGALGWILLLVSALLAVFRRLRRKPRVRRLVTSPTTSGRAAWNLVHY